MEAIFFFGSLQKLGFQSFTNGLFYFRSLCLTGPQCRNFDAIRQFGIANKATTDRPEEIEIVRQNELAEARLLRNVSQIFNDRVFVFVVERIGNVIYKK